MNNNSENAFRGDRVNEEVMSTQGQKMKIIAYRGAFDIDIEFEDGTVVTNKTYSHFKRGYIKNPNFTSPRLGESKVVGGHTVTITAYRKSTDIDIQMDTGEKWEHITYDSFRQGRLPIVMHKELKKKHTIGEKSIANNGQEMELLDYIDSRNVTVRFDDGTVVYNKAYSAFKRGNIGNPSKPLRGMYSGFESAADKRIGEKTVAHNGQEMEIIAYRHFNDIDVKFEDGTIVTNKNYQWFRKGYIRNPNYKKKEQ